VHLLMFDDPELSVPAANYLRDLDDGIPEPEAFADFPFDKPTLDRKVQDLIIHHRIRVKRMVYQRRIAIDEAPVTRMSAAQADAALVRMQYILGEKDDIVTPMAAAALKENPEDPAIQALAARICARYQHPFDVDGLVARLAVGGSEEPQLRIDAAAALIDRGAGADAQNAYSILDGLAHTGSPPVEAVLLWATAARRLDKEPSTIAPLLAPLTARVPHNTRVLRALAYVSEAGGDRAQAREYYNRIILVSESPEERLWAQKQADSTRLAGSP
jgi:hypothetical protein